MQQQRFFSLEAFFHMLSQLLDPKRTPLELETPPYLVLRKTAGYEVRRYQPFVVAEAPVAIAATSSSSSGGGGSAVSSPASRGGVPAFFALVDYISGGNEAQQRYLMTTPVFTDTDGRMQFMIGSGAGTAGVNGAGAAGENGVLPRASGRAAAGGVVTRTLAGEIFAARAFSGVADDQHAAQEATELRRQLLAHGQVPAGDGWLLARYNDPSVLPPFRRNEVLIPVADFQLW